MATIDEIRHANFLVLLARYPTMQAFANAIERSHSQVSQIKTRARHSTSGEPRAIGTEFARHIEAKLGLANGWMDTPHLSEPAAQWAATPSTERVLPVYNSPAVPWGKKMTDALPDLFSVSLPDDSMAPRARKGDVIRFSRHVDPRPGDGVLVQDMAGRWYFRLYRERRPGEWEAHPVNDAYQPMDAQRDGLVLLAVLVGIESQRWG